MDGKMTIEQAREAASRVGLDEICLTEHYEPRHPVPGADIPPTFLMQTEADAHRMLAGVPEVRLGIEIGDNPPYHDEIAQWLRQWDLDYLLLSLHLVDQCDASEPRYFPRYDMNRARSYEAYASAVLDSIRTWEPGEYDALAHLGYVGRYSPFTLEEKPLRWRDAPDIIDEILSTLACNGNALEINTSGYSIFGEPVPGKDILVRFCELGGEFVMFGSDAHGSSAIGRRFADAAALAMECGLTRTIRFDRRKRTIVRIDHRECST